MAWLWVGVWVTSTLYLCDRGHVPGILWGGLVGDGPSRGGDSGGCRERVGAFSNCAGTAGACYRLDHGPGGAGARGPGRTAGGAGVASRMRGTGLHESAVPTNRPRPSSSRRRAVDRTSGLRDLVRTSACRVARVRRSVCDRSKSSTFGGEPEAGGGSCSRRPGHPGARAGASPWPACADTPGRARGCGRRALVRAPRRSTARGTEPVEAPAETRVPAVGPSAQRWADSLGYDAFQKTRVASWHAAGYTGAGVKVGIIDSFNGGVWDSAAQAGRAPARAATCRVFCRGTARIASRPSGTRPPNLGDHGVAVAEAIKDMAPERAAVPRAVQSINDLYAAIDSVRPERCADRQPLARGASTTAQASGTATSTRRSRTPLTRHDMVQLCGQLRRQ